MLTLSQRVIRRARRYSDIVLGERAGRRLPRTRDYLRRTPFALYDGYLGHGNLGDEAIAAAIAGLLPGLPLVDALREPIEMRLHRRVIRGGRADLFIVGGGTLIGTHDHRVALERALGHATPCVTFGTGVRDPAFWTSARERSSMHRWIDALAACRRVSVRGPRSAALLAERGVRHVEVIGDPALSVAAATPTVSSGRVALNLGSHDPIRGDRDALLAAVATAAARLLAQGRELVLVPMHDLDLPPLRALRARLGPGVTLWPDFHDLDATLAQLAACDLVVGQRLHAVVLAFAVGVPAISLAYNPKCDDFLASFELGALAVPTDQVTADGLLAAVADVDARRDALSAHIRAAGDRYRALQRAFADDLAALVSAR